MIVRKIFMFMQMLLKKQVILMVGYGYILNDSTMSLHGYILI